MSMMIIITIVMVMFYYQDYRWCYCWCCYPYAPSETINEEDYCIHHYCPPCSKDLVKGILIKQSKERKTITPLASFNKYSHICLKLFSKGNDCGNSRSREFLIFFEGIGKIWSIIRYKLAKVEMNPGNIY